MEDEYGAIPEGAERVHNSSQGWYSEPHRQPEIVSVRQISPGIHRSILFGSGIPEGFHDFGDVLLDDSEDYNPFLHKGHELLLGPKSNVVYVTSDGPLELGTFLNYEQMVCELDETARELGMDFDRVARMLCRAGERAN